MPEAHFCCVESCAAWGSFGRTKIGTDGVKVTRWRCRVHDEAYQREIAADAAAPRQADSPAAPGKRQGDLL